MKVYVLPPSSQKPDDRESYYVCASDAEWAAAHLRKGDRCWFRNRVRAHCFDIDGPLSQWKAGTFGGSMLLCDGILAVVYEDDPDDLIAHKLSFASGSRYDDDLAPWGSKPGVDR